MYCQAQNANIVRQNSIYFFHVAQWRTIYMDRKIEANEVKYGLTL